MPATRVQKGLAAVVLALIATPPFSGTIPRFCLIFIPTDFVTYNPLALPLVAIPDEAIELTIHELCLRSHAERVAIPHGGK
jgi:hypothetical protein